MRDFLRSVLVGACGLPAVLLAVTLAAAPATASDAGPQRSATPNVTAEIAYARAQVHPGDQDTMTVSLINHGPQSLDDHTSVHVTVTMPQAAEVSPNVVETIPGNAPTGSSNAVPSTRSVPLTQVFVRSAPGFFDVVVPAGSFGDSTSFRTYTFTLNIPSNAPQGAQLIGGGVAVALENYVGLTVVKSVVAPPPVVVAVPKPADKPHKSHKPAAPTVSGGKSGGSGRSGASGTWGGPGASGAGSSEWIQRWMVEGGTGCPGGMMSGGTSSGGGTASGGTSSSGTTSGGTSSGGTTSGGSGHCPCPVDQHMSAPNGGSSSGSSSSGSATGTGGPSTCGCPVNPQMGAPTSGSGGSSGGSASGTGGPMTCMCPVNPHMSAPSSGSSSGGGSNGTQCRAVGLAATGTGSTWPLAIGLLALAGGVALMRMRVARRRNWSRP